MAYTMAEHLKQHKKNFFSTIKKNVEKKKNNTPDITAVKSTAELSGVRESMNKMGLDNSKIGWSNGNVTYNNLSFKPAEVRDGKSYATQKDIQNFVNSAYRAEGKNPVRITDYPAPAGLGGISYSDNGMVAVGGQNIPVLYMDGDRAVVNSADLDEAYRKLKDKTGVKTADELRDTWEKKYGDQLDDAYREMKNYSEWNYDPAADPAYEAYRKMYEREGMRAYRDAAAKLASRNMGNMTSAAQTLANSQLSYYMSMLADRIPELQKNSYERYKNGFDMKQQNYENLREQADADWERAVKVNETAKSDYEKSRENERERTLDGQNDSEKAYKNAWDNAEKRGYFTPEEAGLLGIPVKENGEYYTPNEIKIKDEIQYFTDVTVPKLDYESQLRLVELIKELELKMQNDNQKAERDYQYDKQLAAYKAGLK